MWTLRGFDAIVYDIRSRGENDGIRILRMMWIERIFGGEGGTQRTLRGQRTRREEDMRSIGNTDVSEALEHGMIPVWQHGIFSVQLSNCKLCIKNVIYLSNQRISYARKGYDLGLKSRQYCAMVERTGCSGISVHILSMLSGFRFVGERWRNSRF